MIVTRFDEAFILTFSVMFFLLAVLFAMIWEMSRATMSGMKRTRLSHAQHDFALGFVVVSLAVGGLFMNRWIAGPAEDATYPPTWFRLSLRVMLIIGFLLVFWSGTRVFLALLARKRSATLPGIGISQERILATLAVDLPMIVADQNGIIRYATDPMDALVGAAKDELAGRNLTEIMPSRFRDFHRAGMARYLETGKSRILGQVINVDLLRRDGTEIPVSLALTSSEAEDKQYFIGLMWARETYDQPNVEASNVRQDARELSQNEEDAKLEIRRSRQDDRERSQDRRDAER